MGQIVIGEKQKNIKETKQGEIINNLICYRQLDKFNPVEIEAQINIFTNSLLTLKKIQHVYMTTISWLMLFREIITVCSEDHKKSIFFTLKEKCSY
jgi:hypothetical protein